MANAIEIENLSVRLGSFLALRSITTAVNEGDFAAIIGPNGAGKSTLLRAILGLVPLETGSISLFGQPFDKTSPEWIGYVPQLKTIDRNFPAVTCDLVASGMYRSWPGILTKKDHERVHEALEMVGAENLTHKPLGHLSGGEIQRVYLARAIVRKPRLLLLDEPATGIDAVGEDQMYSILDSYLEQADTTVLMVTHDWLAARHHATKAMLINRNLIAYGPSSEALSDSNLRAAFGHIGHAHHLQEEGDGHV
ncbi:MAG: metal ABC transporter ATP-binding protein [bacterium]|nr:metal ABC transporter ATP-binding protein [bacterium]